MKRKCLTCGLEKDIESFYIHKRWGRIKSCKDCEKQKGAIYRNANKSKRVAVQEKRWGKSADSGPPYNQCQIYTATMNSPITKLKDKFTIATDLRASVYGLCSRVPAYNGMGYLDTYAGITTQPYPGLTYTTIGQMLTNIGLADIPITRGMDFSNLFYLLYTILNNLYISTAEIFYSSTIVRANYSHVKDIPLNKSVLAFPYELPMGEAIVTVYWVQVDGLTHRGIISGSPVTINDPGYSYYLLIDARESMVFK